MFHSSSVISVRPFLFLIPSTFSFIIFQGVFWKNVSFGGDSFICLHEVVCSSALLGFAIH